MSSQYENGSYYIAVAVVIVLLVIIRLCIRYYCCGTRQSSSYTSNVPINRQTILTNQPEDIYSISGRVVPQQPGWPTHDNHVSLDNFTITNENSKNLDAPPSYDEVMRTVPSSSAPPPPPPPQPPAYARSAN